MALKIGGTTVVNDSRGLENISNLKTVGGTTILGTGDIPFPASAPSSHVGATGTAHGVATTSVAGFMSSADKAKLDGVSAGAGAYTHPTSGVTPGSYRVVSVDANGHVNGGLNPTTLSGYGITDATPSSHMNSTGMAHGDATVNTSGFMSGGDKGKLNGIESGANNYIHPSSHPASIIAQDANNRFVTDADKSYWSSKIDASTPQTLSNKTLLTPVISEGVYFVPNVSATPSLSPLDGSIQLWTLASNSQPAFGSWDAGQSITLMIDDGAGFTVTWPAITWVNNAKAAPTLATSGYTVVGLWKVGSGVYGALVGNGA